MICLGVQLSSSRCWAVAAAARSARVRGVVGVLPPALDQTCRLEAMQGPVHGAGRGQLTRIARVGDCFGQRESVRTGVPGLEARHEDPNFEWKQCSGSSTRHDSIMIRYLKISQSDHFRAGAQRFCAARPAPGVDPVGTHHPEVLGSPLNGPTTSSVIHPP